ncbi:SGNH/GDSL hydrolase family protein [Engelhardtia mirabilis]
MTEVGQAWGAGGRLGGIVRRLSASALGLVLAIAVMGPLVPRRALVQWIGVTPSEVLAAVVADPSLRTDVVQAFLAQPEFHAVVGKQLARQVDAVYEAHLDPEVGRILQPGLDQAQSLGALVTSNGLGLRERPFEIRKPAETTRIVLLGDSYVFGYGAPADGRIGVHLERLLRPFCPTPRLEVLHFGVSSWNIQAECAYLRRQVAVMDPDLVIQLVVQNDFVDCLGVGGTGAMSAFSPQARLRGETGIGNNAMRGAFPRPVWNHINLGLDWESRERYRRAAEAIGELVVAVDAIGARYLLVQSMGPIAARAQQLLAADMERGRYASISNAFNDAAENWNSVDDRHWNSHGCERVAQGLLALIDERDLLPGWSVEPSARALLERDQIFAAGEREAEDIEAFEHWVAGKTFVSEFHVPPDSVEVAAAATGGIDQHGNVAPYASLCMRRAGQTLVIDGQVLGRPALIGARMEVFVDELSVGRLALDDPAALPARFDLPRELDGRAIVSVRLRSDDHAYLNAMGEPVCLRLESVRFE